MYEGLLLISCSDYYNITGSLRSQITELIEFKFFLTFIHIFYYQFLIFISLML
jgi:hypothetical protein